MTTNETYVGPRNGCGFLHRHECTGAACDGSKDVSNDSNPFIESDDTCREDEPGDWVIADFDGECSRGGHAFGAKTTVRADSDGGHECRECVDDPAYDEEMFDPELLAKFTASVCADIDRRLAEKGIEL